MDQSKPTVQFDLATFLQNVAPPSEVKPRELSFFVDVWGRSPSRLHLAIVKADGTRTDFVSKKSFDDLKDIPKLQATAQHYQAAYRSGTLIPDAAVWELARPREPRAIATASGATNRGPVPFTADQLQTL